jgi:hypothetical protein
MRRAAGLACRTRNEAAGLGHGGPAAGDLLAATWLSTPRSARELPIANRGPPPGSPVITRAGPPRAGLVQLPGRNMETCYDSAGDLGPQPRRAHACPPREAPAPTRSSSAVPARERSSRPTRRRQDTWRTAGREQRARSREAGHLAPCQRHPASESPPVARHAHAATILYRDGRWRAVSAGAAGVHPSRHGGRG